MTDVDVIKHTHVEYEFHGKYDGQTVTKNVPDRDLSREAKDIPKHGVAFRYYDIVSTTVEVDGESVKLASRRLNVSPLYYVDAEVLTIAQVKERQLDGLASFMTDIGKTEVIRDRLGTFDHMFDSDKHQLVTT